MRSSVTQRSRPWGSRRHWCPLQPFEHFGEVSMKVYDLAEAWERFRAKRERHFLEEVGGVWTYRRHFDFPIAVVWEALTAPELKQRWMANMRAVRAVFSTSLAWKRWFRRIICCAG